jgi:hypothetical protein
MVFNISLLAAACAGLCACTGLEPAAISAGASAAQSGATFFTQGKFSSVELVGFDDAVQAVRMAGEEMSLRLDEDEAELKRVRLVYEDEQGQSIVVVVERRSATVTQIQADVGTFGENGLASLFMRQMAAQLVAMRAHSGESNEP